MKIVKRLIIIIAAIIFLSSIKLSNAYEFPIAELGNCRNTRECHLYCEIPQNKAACWSYSVYGKNSQVLGDETPEATVGELGITFPIAELGNCTNVSECKTFCSDSQNTTSCKAFTQTHNPNHQKRLVARAQEELSCSTLEECRTFCTQETNKTACQAFARRYHLKPLVKKIHLEAVQQQLGCTSKETCEAFCKLSENHETCVQTIRQVNPNFAPTQRELLIEAAKEKLGCVSFQECKKFCQDKTNSSVCRNFGQALSQSIKEMRHQKGDCKTVEECRKACETNPEKCPNFPKFPNNASGSSERSLKRSSSFEGTKSSQRETQLKKVTPVQELLKTYSTQEATPSETSTSN